MAISLKDLTEMMSERTVADWYKFSMVPYLGIDYAKGHKAITVPLADRATANTETKLTETGTWLLKALETMTGFGGWELSAEQYENRITVCEIALHMRFSIGRQDLDERDPVALLDCFTCAACGCDTSRLGPSRWRIQDRERSLGRPTRALCESCGKPAGDDSTVLHIEQRNHRLGIRPEAILWQRGSHGVRLEKAMALTNYDIKIGFDGTPEFFDTNAVARAMGEAFARHTDKLVGQALGAAQVTSSVSLDGGRTIGHVVKTNDDGSVTVAVNSPGGPVESKPAHEFRVGDRVRLSHPGWNAAIRGKVATVLRMGSRGLILKDAIGEWDVNPGEVEPLFKVGSRVRANGCSEGVIAEPFFGNGTRWAVKLSNGVSIAYRDDQLEPLDSPPVPQVNGHDQYAWIQKEGPRGQRCDWCAESGKVSVHATQCAALESLYRDRISAGGADCPEARDEVRRFVKRRSTLIVVNETVTNGDADRVMATRPRSEKMLSLDQRIAAAHVEAKPRHASDWEVFSTATSES